MFLLFSAGLLYLNPTEGFRGVSLDHLAKYPVRPDELRNWLIKHKLPGSYDNPNFLHSSFRPSTEFIRLGAVPEAQEVCNQFIQGEVDELKQRQVQPAGRRLESSGSIGRYILSGLNLLFNCLLRGPGMKWSDASMPHLPQIAAVSAGKSKSTLPSRANDFRAQDRAAREIRNAIRGIQDIRPRDLQRFPVHDVLASMLLSLKSYSTEAEIQEDADLEFILQDQVEGFPVYIGGEEEFDTQAYVWVSRSSRTATIAFRGTQTVTDVVHDLDYRAIPLDEGRPNVLLHAGFRNKFASIQSNALEVLLDSEHLFDKVIYTGHSLGGALATVAAPIVADWLDDKQHHCLTFGSPRVGNQAFVDWFGRSIDVNIRITNEKDPIPSLPFEDLFRHVSKSITMSQDLHLTLVPDTPVGKRFQYALEDVDSFGRMWEDHDLGTYMQRVAKFFKKIN